MPQRHPIPKVGSGTLCKHSFVKIRYVSACSISVLDKCDVPPVYPRRPACLSLLCPAAIEGATGRVRMPAALQPILDWVPPLNDLSANRTDNTTWYDVPVYLSVIRCPSRKRQSGWITRVSEEIWMALNIEVLGADGVIVVRMEQHRNEMAGGTGDPREDPPTNGIVRHDSHMRRLGVTRPGIEPGSPWWGASRLTAQPPWPLGEYRLFKVKRTELDSRRGRPLAFRTRGSCWIMPLVGGFSRGSPITPALAFRLCSIPRFILIVSQRLDVKSRPNFITHPNASPSDFKVPGLVPGEYGAAPGDSREIPPTSGIVRHNSHLRKSGVTRPGMGPASQANRSATVALISSNIYSNSSRTRHQNGVAGQQYVEMPFDSQRLVTQSPTSSSANRKLSRHAVPNHTQDPSPGRHAANQLMGTSTCSGQYPAKNILLVCNVQRPENFAGSFLDNQVLTRPPLVLCEMLHSRIPRSKTVVNRVARERAPSAKLYPSLPPIITRLSLCPSSACLVKYCGRDELIAPDRICTVRRHGGNTARLARRSDEALGVRPGHELRYTVRCASGVLTYGKNSRFRRGLLSAFKTSRTLENTVTEYSIKAKTTFSKRRLTRSATTRSLHASSEPWAKQCRPYCSCASGLHVDGNPKVAAWLESFRTSEAWKHGSAKGDSGTSHRNGECPKIFIKSITRLFSGGHITVCRNNNGNSVLHSTCVTGARVTLVIGRNTFSFFRLHSGYWFLLRAPSVYSTEQAPAYLGTLHHMPLFLRKFFTPFGPTSRGAVGWCATDLGCGRLWVGIPGKAWARRSFRETFPGEPQRNELHVRAPRPITNTVDAALPGNKWPVINNSTWMCGCARERKHDERSKKNTPLCWLNVALDACKLFYKLAGKKVMCVKSARVLLASSHQCEPGLISGRDTPGFSQVGIVPDYVAVRRVFSRISRFLPQLHSGAAPFSPHVTLVNSQDLAVNSWMDPRGNFFVQGQEATLTRTPSFIAPTRKAYSVSVVMMYCENYICNSGILLRAMKEHRLNYARIFVLFSCLVRKLHRVVPGVVWTNRTMVSSNTDTNRTACSSGYRQG
ncbi:hypothetical protein PR048_022160 [Dryococelus australis]|uniref:Uncharacterized protein n=1 Tax=Dryococelus australis TaxID=614101 RepID=A0ABQ9H0B4_9NEOP|nr:hypothetical protein PR048_022160 [Dryococelus australis]